MAGGWEGSDRRSRLPYDWPRRRARVLRRDRWRCTALVDGVPCGALATEVDHVERGDDHDERNLTSLCRHHHARKSGAEGAAARHAHGSRARAPEPHPGLRRSQ